MIPHSLRPSYRTMWQIQEPTADPKTAAIPDLTGTWSSDGKDWICSASGGARGITLGDADSSFQLSVANVGSDTLPVSGEQYVSGDSWKIDYPQVTGQYRLRLSIRVVHASATRIVWEPTFSIQTSLLDTDPSLELTAIGRFDETANANLPADLPDDVSVSAIRAGDGNGQLLVLLGPQDAPFTKHRSSGKRLDLRVFGEFLEKGVIRKARPWVILDRTDAGVSSEDLSRYCNELCNTPLPLTA
ncbi:hypothetical protein FHS27_005783 [Rhodopirellula rubra]|uniref:Uncharacterized protein n=1 Tax=Aporhodopirellula rubra TaxID=980271 RepID=A0A7W5E5I0_9BACT|nr:hypothetical protein [Aporhodopirellula rubra]MBB3209938.1 hypothetical protein [Aporhodopirellula rubra]